MQSLDDCEAQTKFTTFFSVAGMEDNDLMIRIHERDDVIVGCYAAGRGQTLFPEIPKR